MVLEAGHFRK